MIRQDAIIRSKLKPPRLPSNTLTRPRVDALLRQALDYRLTILQVGAGYGKSTALAQMTAGKLPHFWYSVSDGDADPQQFLTYLIATFRLGLPELNDAPYAILEYPHTGSLYAATIALVNAISDALKSPALLIVDDYHLAASPEVNGLFDTFLQFAPADLRVIVSTRVAPTWEHLVTWRAHGHAFEIKRAALAFTRDEIARLFRETYGVELSPRDIILLEEKTEGWSIGLQLVWQELRANPTTPVAQILAREHFDSSASLNTLFAYLARDVLAQQSEAVRTFLLESAVLRELDARACRAVTHHADCAPLIEYLRERDLFIIALDHAHYRYHHLFHDFLREHAARLDADATRARHQRAAEWFESIENTDEAIYHWLHARAYDRALALIEHIGEKVLRDGKLETLAHWIAEIPGADIPAHPQVMFLLGELARLHSNFKDALAWYAQAEHAWNNANDLRGMASALRGQALVYIDTVNPTQAESLLERALRLTDGIDDRTTRARLLELLAENKVNMGKMQEGEELQQAARALREGGPSETTLSVRAKVRTGRLNQAREILERWTHEEQGQARAPRGHRESVLLLSLIYSLLGRADDALAAAQASVNLGTQFAAPFISAIGQTRLAHAHQLRGEINLALEYYKASVALGDQLAVRRIRAEAMWGMTRAYGILGDLPSAQHTAAEGIAIGNEAGDVWVAAMIQLALGAAYAFCGRDRDAVDKLREALAILRSCGDTFGQCAAQMWLALAQWHLNQRDRAFAHLSDALALAQTHEYDPLFTTRTLLGFHDARIIAPLLVDARKRGIAAAYLTRLLAVNGLENVETHPGYQLRVQMLGAFRVWRGENEILSREWTRKKARQLFQLFLTHRRRLLKRDEIFEHLWRNESIETATRDFRVALNALNNTLAPGREEAASPFIVRQESAYGLHPNADVWIDAEEFSQLVARGETLADERACEVLRRALALYHDDYLSIDARYDDWAIAERERLAALYLRAANRLATELSAQNAFEECLVWCEKILTRDPCWEHAYRLMMHAYAQRGDRALAQRAFERCIHALEHDLGIAPSAATLEVYRQIMNQATAAVTPRTR
jgi:ATP/maltotriose-dependent transcriptional regulator MalT/DNA-binding SARP family transcriptional activator